MILTLYKNCILNDNYNEVFDLTKKTRVIDGITESYSVFTDYLKGLDKTTINVPNVYYSRNMSFTLGISGENKAKEAFEYNYCKIEAEGIVRYCFITDIELANSVATYYTEEDIWSNYAYDMQFRYGYLTNSRKLDYKINNNKKQINYYLLPTGYQSNNAPSYARLNPFMFETSYNVILQIQCYSLTEKGAVSKRMIRTAILGNAEKNGTKWEFKTTSFLSGEVEQVLSYLQAESSDTVLIKGADLNDYFGEEAIHFQIDNITIIPSKFGLGKLINNKEQDDILEAVIGASVYNAETFGITFLNLPKLYNASLLNYGSPELLFSYKLSNDFKIVSFGTRTSQYEINMNGTDIEYDLLIATDNTNFKMLLSFQNKCIDITSDFTYDIPFTALTADVTAQRRIAYNTAMYNGVAEIIGGAADTALNIVSLSGGNITGGSVIKEQRRYGTTKRGKKYLTSKKRTEEDFKNPLGSGSAEGVLGGVRSIADGIVGIVNANTPKYTTNTGTFVKSEALVNAQFALCCMKINPDNSEFVENYTNLVGYVVYEIIKDNILFYQDFTDYNICKFETVDIYGSFPQSIKLELEDILTSGFKIWYNSELKEKIENADIQ